MPPLSVPPQFGGEGRLPEVENSKFRINMDDIRYCDVTGFRAAPNFHVSRSPVQAA